MKPGPLTDNEIADFKRIVAALLASGQFTENDHGRHTFDPRVFETAARLQTLEREFLERFTRDPL